MPDPRLPDPRLIVKLFTRFEADKPDPKTELDFINPYTLVVAVALSAQTTDKAVNKATKPLFDLAYNPFDMVALGEEKLSAMIASIGLYRTKAKNVIKLSQILIDNYGGQVPLNRDALMALPGVGRKTASVVLNELNIEPAIAVDTHVYRVSHRLGIADATTPDKVEAQLMAIIPQKWLTRAHHWLILHGRYTCVARKPMCGNCIVADLCPKIGV
ncbi:endonuclease III [Asticcacaulis sp. ZE23SCel15]|uniref:endonuclease III n=1 Tax=Asticcacaulis sp. ZE23SCel15 TaxID=3059027 RepID=UPI00265D6C31|nr:endonuclease III [Asticcacaulis sp. ZE23SCel15]WKL57856.1 endonuclease III [Asticcacaulis sp. ZE23SCel15]